jgi:hypothetical protein
MKWFKRFILLALMSFLAACDGGVTDCMQEIFFVNNYEDVFTSACTAEHCTIRDAVYAANTCTLHASYSIQLPDGTIHLSQRGPDDNRGDLDIRRNVTILGSGGERSIISGSEINTRMFEVHPGVTATFQNFDITQASTSDNGAGIYNAGTLNLNGMALVNNHTSNKGGGLYNVGTATLVGVDVLINSANVPYSWGCGGGIYNEGSLRIDFSTIEGNDAYSGAGICNLHPGDLLMSDAQISNNGTSRFAGLGGGLHSVSSGLVRLENTHIFNNAKYYGGGIYFTRGPLEIVFSSINYNDALLGGGIFMGASGNLTVEGTPIQGNRAYQAPSRAGGMSGGWGGGVNLTGSNFSFLDSPIFENIAEGGGGAIYLDFGGPGQGYFSHDHITNNENPNGPGGALYVNRGGILLANTTISNNRAQNHGIALYNDAGGRVRLVHVTVADNFGASGIGETYVVMNETGGTVTFKNTLLIGYGGASCFGDRSGYNSEGWNYGEYGSLCGMNRTDDLTAITIPPMSLYLPLFDFDGTLIHPLVPTAVVVDHIPLIECNREDQRHVSRFLGSACDVGAYELQAIAMTDTESDIVIPTPTDTPGSPLTEIVVILTGNARCRTGPGTVYDDHEFFSSGDQTTATGRNFDASWLYVAALTNGGNCWVARAVLQFDVADEIILSLPELIPPPTPTPSPQPSLTPTVQGTAPAAPQQASYDGQVCSGGAYTVSFSWTDVATNETGYRILRNGAEIVSLPANTQSYTDSPPYGGPYTYTIQAYNTFGSGQTTVQDPGCLP